jgi:hypothetical protein
MPGFNFVPFGGPSAGGPPTLQQLAGTLTQWGALIPTYQAGVNGLGQVGCLDPATFDSGSLSIQRGPAGLAARFSATGSGADTRARSNPLAFANEAEWYARCRFALLDPPSDATFLFGFSTRDDATPSGPSAQYAALQSTGSNWLWTIKGIPDGQSSGTSVAVDTSILTAEIAISPAAFNGTRMTCSLKDDDGNVLNSTVIEGEGTSSPLETVAMYLGAWIESKVAGTVSFDLYEMFIGR